MRTQYVLGSLACLTAWSYASPIGSPVDDSSSPIEERNILVPGSLIPTSAVNPATWPAGTFTGTPKFMPTSLVVLGRRDENRRNLLVPASEMPTTTVDPATWSTGTWTGTPRFMPTSLVFLGRRDLTSYPDLVPTSTVDLATDSTGTATFTGMPDLMPSTVVKLGTTTGCEVSMATYTHSSAHTSELEYSYVTHCSKNASKTKEGASTTTTRVPKCCGGESDMYPCNADGSMPTATTRWKCTYGSSTMAGVALATTTWV